jgi:hypothetical protein
VALAGVLLRWLPAPDLLELLRLRLGLGWLDLHRSLLGRTKVVENNGPLWAYLENNGPYLYWA